MFETANHAKYSNQKPGMNRARSTTVVPAKLFPFSRILRISRFEFLSALNPLSRRSEAKTDQFSSLNQPSLHANAIEIGTGTDGIGVRIARRASLTENVTLDGRERRLHQKIGSALKVINPVVHALPDHDQT